MSGLSEGTGTLPITACLGMVPACLPSYTKIYSSLLERFQGQDLVLLGLFIRLSLAGKERSEQAPAPLHTCCPLSLSVSSPARLILDHFRVPSPLCSSHVWCFTCHKHCTSGVSLFSPLPVWSCLLFKHLYSLYIALFFPLVHLYRLPACELLNMSWQKTTLGPQAAFHLYLYL